MSQQQESIYCQSCGRNTLHARQLSSGCAIASLLLIGVVLSAFGLWILGVLLIAIAVIWLFAAAIGNAFSKWRCQTCGRTNPNRYMSNSPRG